MGYGQDYIHVRDPHTTCMGLYCTTDDLPLPFVSATPTQTYPWIIDLYNALPADHFVEKCKYGKRAYVIRAVLWSIKLALIHGQDLTNSSVGYSSFDTFLLIVKAFLLYGQSWAKSPIQFSCSLPILSAISNMYWNNLALQVPASKEKQSLVKFSRYCLQAFSLC